MRIFTPTAALFLCLAVVPPTPGSDLAAIVQRVQDRYDSTRDFTASVEQEITVASVGRTLRAAGTVAFKRPGKMRWTLENHQKQIIVADGSALWFYEPEEHQVLKAPFAAAFRSSAPISFLTGVGRITDNFEVTLGDSEKGRIELLLHPRKAEDDLGRLSLTVDAATFDIIGARVVDVLGNVTRIHLTNLARNVGLADEMFRFEVPPGVDVIEAPLGF